MYRKPEVRSLGSAQDRILGIVDDFAEALGSACTDPSRDAFDPTAYDGQGNPLPCENCTA